MCTQPWPAHQKGEGKPGGSVGLAGHPALGSAQQGFIQAVQEPDPCPADPPPTRLQARPVSAAPGL